MRDNYDFSKGIKNPYADKLKNGYSVTIHYDFSTQDDEEENMKSNDVNDVLKVQECTQEYVKTAKPNVK